MNEILGMFSYDFMVRAMIAGVLLAICAALVGAPLVLRRNSMIGDGLSHVGFGAFAIATVLGLAPVEFALPIVLLASFVILRLGRNSKINGDAAIALMSVSCLAIGVFVMSVVKGVGTDIDSYLFGSILAVSWGQVVMSGVLVGVVVILYVLTYHKIFAITFDEQFAKSIGVKTELYNMIFAGLCSVVVVLGMRLVGALLISGLIVFPTLTAMQIVKKFRSVVLLSVVLSVVAFVVGMVLSYLYATPTGATVIIVNLGVFGVCKLLGGAVHNPY